jgi:hypothetical protein
MESRSCAAAPKPAIGTLLQTRARIDRHQPRLRVANLRLVASPLLWPLLEEFMKFANRLRLSGTLCVGTLCIAVAGVCAQAQQGPHEEFTCTSGAVTRLISIFNLSASQGQTGACRVDYTKDGTTSTLWSSRNDYPYCVEKALSLVTKLTESNYSCKPEAKEQPGADRAD